MTYVAIKLDRFVNGVRIGLSSSHIQQLVIPAQWLRSDRCATGDAATLLFRMPSDLTFFAGEVLGVVSWYARARCSGIVLVASLRSIDNLIPFLQRPTVARSLVIARSVDCAFRRKQSIARY